MAPKISNPLTVVAIFAGLAEAFATFALVNVPLEIQHIFVYFVMAFPITIVVLFFAVLNWNHTVLYAPSDFEDEGMYLESIRLRDTLKSEIIGSLSEESPEGKALTPEQIKKVSEKLDKVIEDVSQIPRKQQILELLSERPSSTTEITQQLHLNRSYAYRLLGALSDEGKIAQDKSQGAVRWSSTAKSV